MKEVHAFETKIVGIKELIIRTINYDCNRLLSDLDLKKNKKGDQKR